MSSETLVILGAGGHAEVCYEIAVAMDKWKKIIVLDDNPINDFFEISGKLTDVDNYQLDDFFVAIGDNSIRKQILGRLINNNYTIVTLIHPKTVISPSVSIGNGSVVMPGVVINANTTISNGVILNTSSTVDHDCIIDSFAHISPGVHIAGNVDIGIETWVGLGSTVINNIKIADDVVIGAGGVVINSIIKKGTYVGCPAMKL